MLFRDHVQAAVALGIRVLDCNPTCHVLWQTIWEEGGRNVEGLAVAVRGEPRLTETRVHIKGQDIKGGKETGVLEVGGRGLDL
jgi:hypothetical protein